MTTRKWIEAELERHLDRADRAGKRANLSEPRVADARYLPSSRTLQIRLTNGASLTLPVVAIPELRSANRADLTDIEVLPGGDALHWRRLDLAISVPGLVASLFGPSTWMSELGRRGGARSTLAKAAAARRNGMRGGRPRAA